MKTEVRTGSGSLYAPRVVSVPSRSSAVLLALTAGAWASPARSEPARDGVRVDQLQPASPESAFIRAEGPHTPVPGSIEYAVGIVADYQRRPLQAYGVDVTGAKSELRSPVGEAELIHVGASITPVHWLSLDASVPFAVREVSDISPSQPVVFAGQAAPAGTTGSGDLRTGLRLRVVDRPDFGLFLGGRFWAPVGSADAYLSDHRFRAELQLGAFGEKPASMYGVSLGLAPMFFKGRDGDRIAVAAAFHRKLGETVSLGIEPTVAVFRDSNLEGAASLPWLAEPLVSLRLRTRGLNLGLALGPGFGHAPGLAEFRGVLSVAYAGKGKPGAPPPPPAKDSDVDGIPDSSDACPKEAGLPSVDAARNGCPAGDRDGDSIPDVEDACPETIGVRSADKHANGCSDSDNDLVPDPIDACPKEPGTAPSGCPQFVRLGQDGFVVSIPLEFKSGEIRLPDQVSRALQEVAAILRANPKIEQISVSLGTKGAIAAVSDKRAQALLAVLQASSLDSSRYVVVLGDERNGVIQLRIVR